jgi:hypothetical protein
MSTTATETAKDTPKLVCQECRHENLLERIYCHECGTKLDRSAVRRKKEPIEDTHKRVKRMFDPNRAKMRAYSVAFGKTLFAAALVAVIVDMFLPPEIPPPNKKQMMISSLRFDLESMATKGQPPTKQVTDEEATSFLTSALKPKQTALDKPLLPFKRAVVAFHENRCVITTERSVSDYWPVYASCSFTPELKSGKLLGKINGGWIGRLPIHPKLAQYMGVMFADVATALDRDLKLVAKLGAIELHEKTVTLSAATAAP